MVSKSTPQYRSEAFARGPFLAALLERAIFIQAARDTLYDITDGRMAQHCFSWSCP
jgi:hypothetical protein